jgi:hypothetical protein
MDPADALAHIHPLTIEGTIALESTFEGTLKEEYTAVATTDIQKIPTHCEKKTALLSSKITLFVSTVRL